MTRSGACPLEGCPLNDARYFTAPGFGGADEFYRYLVVSFERLHEEGARAPRMMSIGLHCRISGRPGRATAIDRFLTHLRQRDGVWLARHDEIARYWLERYPPQGLVTSHSNPRA